MKKSILLFVGCCLLVNQHFAQAPSAAFAPIKEHLERWDDIRGAWLAQAIQALAAKQAIPGLGHPIHKPVDPRTKPLLAIAGRNGFGGVYIDLVQRVQREAERKSGKNLPLNATGAIGAIACELGFEWGVIRGFGVLARSIGLVGHIMEERRNPLALKVWTAAEDEASSHFKEA